MIFFTQGIIAVWDDEYKGFSTYDMFKT
jgi:hypothetical protein